MGTVGRCAAVPSELRKERLRVVVLNVSGAVMQKRVVGALGSEDEVAGQRRWMLEYVWLVKATVEAM